MYRLIISFLLEGIVIGSGLALFLSIGRYKASWQMVVGFVAAIMLTNVIRLIPVLRFESTLQQLLREAGDDRDKVEALLSRKQRPLVSVGAFVLVALGCILGLIVRLIT